MLSNLRRYFITGLIVFLPATFSVYLFVWIINAADKLLGKFLEPIFYDQFGFYFRGLNIIIGVYVIVVIGFLATNFFGKKLYDAFEHLMIKLPFFRQVYPAIKEMALFLFTRDKLSFKKVVIIEYPKKNVYALGFLTNDASEKINKLTGDELCNVFLSSSPSPLTGFVLMVPKKDIIMTDISVEEAVKFIVSGGVVAP